MPIAGFSPELMYARESFQIGSTTFTPIVSSAGGYVNIDSAGFQVIPNPRLGKPVPQITISDVLAGRIDPKSIRGKIVLVGAVAPSLNDYFLASSTNKSQNPLIPGVQLQAKYISYLLDSVLLGKPPIGFWPEWVETFWIWAWAGIGGAIAWRIQKPLAAALASGGTMVGLLGISLVLLGNSTWVPIVAPGVALTLTFVSVLASYRWEEHFLDKVTQLPKRKFLLKHLEASLQEVATAPNRNLALALFSFDRLAEIRKGLGDWQANRALAAIASDTSQSFEKWGMVARVGDSELAAAVVCSDRCGEFARTVDELRGQLAQPRTVDELVSILKPDVSIVWSSQYSSPPSPEMMLEDAYATIEQLPSNREAASLLEAKTLRQSVLDNIRGEVLIQEALDRQHFELHYQPIVDLPTQRVVGFEALVRLRSPEHGMIPPVKFIPIAEKTGQIIPLGQWILQEACQQTRKWQDLFPHLGTLTINVNISAQQFGQPNWVDFVAEVLADTGLEGNALAFEITEGVVMKNIDRTLKTIERLKQLDIEIAIDDFGTGFSSLSYLRDFNVDVLKIDRSFVSRMRSSEKDLAIVKTIVALCKLLRLQALAEGVETQEEYRDLLESGCQLGQGYLFAKPMDAAATTQYLSQLGAPETQEMQ